MLHSLLSLCRSLNVRNASVCILLRQGDLVLTSLSLEGQYRSGGHRVHISHVPYRRDIIADHLASHKSLMRIANSHGRCERAMSAVDDIELLFQAARAR